MSAISRAQAEDSCPGAVRLHQAADGGLARVRIPGGVLTAAQWQALVAAARELGNGRLELTSRGNLQLRGLPDGGEAPLAARLQQAGLLPAPSHERVRNLLASPLSGRDGSGLADVRPLIAEFDHALCARPALAELSGRFLFALDDGRADVLAAGPDIAVTASSPESMQLLLAGRPTGAPVTGPAVVELMLAAAEAFLAERRAQGSPAWRLVELADGPGRVATRLAASGHLASKADLASGADGAADTGATVAFCAPEPGPIRQQDGADALVVGIPLGSLGLDQADALLGRLLVLTPWRSIVLPDLTDAEITALLVRCAEVGMITAPSHPLHEVTACTGRPGCGSALADVRADALAVHRADALGVDRASPPGEPVSGVHWSGCARRCGRPAGTVVDVIATGSGYQVHRGGTSVEVTGTPVELAAALRTDSALAGVR